MAVKASVLIRLRGRFQGWRVGAAARSWTPIDANDLIRRAFVVFPSCQKSVKEGILLKQTSSFQRWKRRYFKLRGRTLYYAKDCKVGKVAAPAWLAGLTRVRSLRLQSLIFDEVDLSDASVAETSTKNINNSFTVSRRLPC